MQIFDLLEVHHPELGPNVKINAHDFDSTIHTLMSDILSGKAKPKKILKRAVGGVIQTIGEKLVGDSDQSETETEAEKPEEADPFAGLKE